MRYLLDTGILARLVHRDDPEHRSIRNAMRALAADGHVFVCARQNIVEFWNLCTRPASARGGYDLPTAETDRRVRLLERFVEILKEPDSTYRHWRTLVTQHSVRGRQVHDARIAAVMAAYRIRRILTLNTSDFARYGKIEAITPSEVLTGNRA